MWGRGNAYGWQDTVYVDRGIKEGFLEKLMMKLEVEGQVSLARCKGKKGGKDWVPLKARDRRIGATSQLDCKWVGD